MLALAVELPVDELLVAFQYERDICPRAPIGVEVAHSKALVMAHVLVENPDGERLVRHAITLPAGE